MSGIAEVGTVVSATVLHSKMQITDKYSVNNVYSIQKFLTQYYNRSTIVKSN